MAEPADLGHVLRRVSEANLRYYEALGKVTVDYWTSVFGVLGEISGRRAASPAPAPPPAAPAPQQQSAPAPAMVLEAPPGGQAMGAFLVENKLAQRLSTPIVASTFIADDGREVRPKLQLDPEVVTLEPGEQVLVRVLAMVDDQLEAGVTYRGHVTIPGLSGHTVRLVLRRRSDMAPASSPAAPAPTPPAPTPTPPASRARRRAAPRAPTPGTRRPTPG